MGRFVQGKEPLLRLLTRNKFRYILAEAVIYEDDNLRIYDAPKGFKTDLASIPSLLPHRLHQPSIQSAAIIHDRLYQQGRVSRKQADNIFYRAMLAGGTSKIRATVYFWAVRLFGFLAWRRRNNVQGKCTI